MADITVDYLKKRGGVYKRVEAFESGYVNDGVKGIEDGGLKWQRLSKGAPSNNEAGIFSDGTNVAARMSTVYALSDIQEVIFDGGGAITINSDIVIPDDKVITVFPGTYFAGTGKITGGILNAMSDEHTVFASNIRVNLSGCSKPYFAAKNFNAYGDNVKDDLADLTKLSDMILQNPVLPRTLKMQKGDYKISNTWELMLWNTTTLKYDFSSINVLGEEYTYFTGYQFSTNIRPNFSDRPKVNFQCLKSSSWKGVGIIGLFQPSYPTYADFCQVKYEDFGPPDFRDSQYSPDCGIAIDAYGIIVPPDGGYPLKSAMYRGPSGGLQGGSSAITIEYCRIEGNIVNVMYSPNNTIQNCESMILRHCAIENCRTGVAYGQDQTKNNTVDHIISWSATHTCIGNGRYGATQGCPPKVDTWDIAGQVNQFCDIQCPGRFGFTAYNIYAEQLFRIGRCNAAPSIINGEFDFATVTDNVGAGAPDFYFRGANVTFLSGKMRLYDGLFNKRLHMDAVGCTFIGVQFDLPPWFAPVTNNNRPNKFYNCKVGVNGYGILSDEISISEPNFTTALAAMGKVKIEIDSFQDAKSIYEYNESRYDNSGIDAAAPLLVTVNTATRTATFTVAQANLRWKLNEYLYARDLANANGVTLFDDDTTLLSNPLLGRITGLTSTVVTLSDVPINITTGNYYMRTTWLEFPYAPFMGNVSAGSNVITNVEVSDPNSWPAAGMRISTNGYSAIVQSVDQLAKTVTVNYESFIYPTITNAVFQNGNPKVTIKALYPPSSPGFANNPIAIMPGTEWIVNYEPVAGEFKTRKFVFTKGGYISPGSVPGGIATRQAQWVEVLYPGGTEEQDPFSLTADGSRAIEAGKKVSIDLKPTTAMKIRIGTTPGGYELFGESLTADMVAMTPNQTETLVENANFDSAGTIYFSGDFAGGTAAIKITKKNL